MKLSITLITICSLCDAFLIPSRNLTSHPTLEVREGQSLINPDNEPPYEDPVTGDRVEKSRILSGVGPDAARNRWYDWDESCSDVGQRERIVIAWENFQPLVTKASERLTTLKDSLPTPAKDSGNPNEENRKYIIAEDPAYMQMFKARDTGLKQVTGAYDSITQNLKNFPDRGSDRRYRPALRFICNADGHVKDGNGDPFCGSGAEESHAITLTPQGAQDTVIERKYRFETSSSITFCPLFFDDQKFPNIHSIWGNDKPDLNTVDCRERIILHEYLHLQWTMNMNPRPDYVGYYDASNAAATLSWNSVKSTPDCYAWYALYSAYNNEHKGCERDIWPAGVEKPVKN